MKRTERIAIALTKNEKARIRIEASDLHISMSAFCRMKIFTQVTYSSYNSLPSLNRPPRAPTSVKLDLYPERTKFVSDNPKLLGEFSIELKIKIKERRSKIEEEEELLKEVEIN